MLENREDMLHNRHQRECEKLTEHTQRLLPLVIGDHVHVRNQSGQFPLKWDKTGIIIEVKQNYQYFAKVDGSGRLTRRNRKFL